MTRVSPRGYDLLTPDERLSAAIAAMARGDDQEVERLQSACPRVTYRMLDAEFTDPFYYSYEVARSFSMGALDMLASVHLLAALRDMTRLRAVSMERGFALGLAAVGQIPGAGAALRNLDSVVAALTATADEYDSALATRLVELKSLDAGYRRFCEDVRLDADAVLAWSPVVADRMAAVHELLLAVEPDPEAERVYWETFHDVWEV